MLMTDVRCVTLSSKITHHRSFIVCPGYSRPTPQYLPRQEGHTQHKLWHFACKTLIALFSQKQQTFFTCLLAMPQSYKGKAEWSTLSENNWMIVWVGVWVDGCLCVGVCVWVWMSGFKANWLNQIPVYSCCSAYYWWLIKDLWKKGELKGDVMWEEWQNPYHPRSPEDAHSAGVHWQSVEVTSCIARTLNNNRGGASIVLVFIRLAKETNAASLASEWDAKYMMWCHSLNEC